MSEHFVGIKVDDTIHNHLEQKSNMSEYIRRLIRTDMEGDSADLVSLRTQVETLEKQAQQHREQKEMFEDRAEQMRDMIAEAEQRTDYKLQDALEKLEKTPRDPTNPAIRSWAADVGLSPQELVDELEQEYDGREYTS